jgi:hypothetical protein
MHRSGTSALTRIVNMLGLPVGRDDDLVSPRRTNEKGQWESTSLTGFQEALLRRLGGSWDAPPRLEPGWERSPRLLREVGRARRIFQLVYGDAPVWVWKDPRTSLTLPFWRRALRAQALLPVVIHRNPLDVARSLATRDGIEKGVALGLWETYNRTLLANVQGLPTLYVGYERLVQDPVALAERVRTFLAAYGVPVGAVPENEVREFVDRGLRHHRSSPEALRSDPAVGDDQRELVRRLESLEDARSAVAEAS